MKTKKPVPKAKTMGDMMGKKPPRLTKAPAAKAPIPKLRALKAKKVY